MGHLDPIQLGYATQAAIDSDDPGDKLKRIHEIRAAGFEVAHVTHRHGLDDTRPSRSSPH